MAFLDEVGLAELWSLIRAEDANVVAEGVKIATGSYTGSGTAGSSNKNSLTFDFEPELIFISGNWGANYMKTGPHILHVRSGKYLCNPGVNNYECKGLIESSGNTVYWYESGNSTSGNPQAQGNYGGYTYQYIAIGV